jgi:hypothetical protein
LADPYEIAKLIFSILFGKIKILKGKALKGPARAQRVYSFEIKNFKCPAAERRELQNNKEIPKLN